MSKTCNFNASSFFCSYSLKDSSAISYSASLSYSNSNSFLLGIHARISDGVFLNFIIFGFAKPAGINYLSSWLSFFLSLNISIWLFLLDFSISI